MLNGLGAFGGCPRAISLKGQKDQLVLHDFLTLQTTYSGGNFLCYALKEWRKMMIKYNFTKTLTAGVVLTMAICSQSFAINQEIECSSDAPAGSHCWQCGSNCYATLTGTTMNITGSGDLDATGSRSNTLTSSSWGDYDIKILNIGKDITSIGNHSFRGMPIQKVNFEEGSKLKTIGEASLPDVTDKNLLLPESLTSISGWALMKASNIYCTASQMNGVCKNISHLNLTSVQQTVKQYEKQGDKIIINDGDETLIYNLDFTKQYDAKGNILAEYDDVGNLTANYVYDSGGNLTSVYSNGIATYRRTSYTPAEAAKAVKKGNNNKVTLTFK